MAVVPTTLQGRDLDSCTVYPGSVNPTTGVITWGTGVDISQSQGSASFKGFEVNGTAEGLDVSPSDAVFRTNLTEIYDISFNVTEIQSSNGTTNLTRIYLTASHIKVVATYRKRGSSAAITYRAVMGRIAGAPIPLNNGLNMVQLSADSIGYGLYEGASPLPAAFS